MIGRSIATVGTVLFAIGMILAILIVAGVTGSSELGFSIDGIESVIIFCVIGIVFIVAGAKIEAKKLSR